MQHNQLPASVQDLYPWPGQYIQVGDGHRMHYLDEGKGEPVLMVHGNPTWSFYWRDLVHGLSADYRCIVPDHIGCGLSDKPQDFEYRLANHIDNLSELIEALDLHDITLLVHDWGGAIGIGAALKHPDRIKRLVVFNTSVMMGPIHWSIRMCRVPLFGSTVVRGFNGFVRVGLIRAVADRSRMKGAVGKGYLAPFDSWNNRIAQHEFVMDIPIEENHPTRKTLQEIDDRLGELAHLPAMIVWGEKDFVFTTHFCDLFEQRLPQAEVHRIPDASHFVVEEAHERILPWLRDFMARHPLQA